MKTRWIAAGAAAMWLCASSSARAADPTAIEQSVAAGLQYLVSQQLPKAPDPGAFQAHWTVYGWAPYDAGATGLALLKLVDRAKELGRNPFETDPASPQYYQYALNVEAGFTFLFNQMTITPSGTVAIYPHATGGTYGTSIALMAIASTNQPTRPVTVGAAAGMTYAQVAQGLARWLVDNQGTVAERCDEGGWDYQAIYQTWADQSNSGYATIALGIAAAAPPQGFGIGIPIGVLQHLDEYVENSQVMTAGDEHGGSVYNPCWPADLHWTNTLKTGNLLYELALVGATPDTEQVKAAVDYIGRHWDADALPYPYSYYGWGWKTSYQAMFTMMKGLSALQIPTVPVSGSDVDWFAEMSDRLVALQEADGSFMELGDLEGEETPIMRTVWALLAIERAVPIVNLGIPDQCVMSGTPFDVIHPDGTIQGGNPPFSWTAAGQSSLGVTITPPPPENLIEVAYPVDFLGQETITFTVTDRLGLSSNDPATFKVDVKPVVLQIPSQTAPFTPFDLEAYYGSPGPEPTWSFSGNTCLTVAIGTDADGHDDVVTVTNPGGCTEPEAITFLATINSCTKAASASATAVFTPNQPPSCAAAVASLQCVWPPDNKMVPIDILGVTDPDGDPLTILVTSVSSDEATATEPGAAGKNHAPDATGVGTARASVRAERSGLRDGRVYLIHFNASDGKGGVCEGAVSVGVPHDEGQGACPAVDSGQSHDATTVN